MNVYLSFDVEVWCNGWSELDVRFPGSFDRYVYGRSSRGNFALPKTLEILNRYGLRGVFFVEPLFSARFGEIYLDEIVGLISSAGHDIQLHLHPEWVDEIFPGLIDDFRVKRQYLSAYTQEEQSALIAWGKRALERVVKHKITAFRAGSYAANSDTYVALAENEIYIDSSLNACMPIDGSDMRAAVAAGAPWRQGNVLTYPVTVFRDGFGRYRPAQVGACSFEELKQALLDAASNGAEHFVIVSHNFEMLKTGRSAPDLIVANRFEQLCKYLSVNSEVFKTSSFDRVDSGCPWVTPTVSFAATGRRFIEQSLRRMF